MFSSILFLALIQAVRTAAYVQQAFDYVIVGGGPAGLIVANRLSADPEVTVAVIEAGDSAYNNPNVSYVPQSITEYGLFIGTSIDWKYMTAPQKYAGNSTLLYWAGKALGGSTTINGMTYLRAEKDQIDAWEELGNECWNWDSMWHYYLAQEGFQAPSDELRKQGAIYEDDAHGKSGELAVAFTPYLVGQGFSDLLKETSEAIGYPYNEDANNGTMRGFNSWPMTLNETERFTSRLLSRDQTFTSSSTLRRHEFNGMRDMRRLNYLPLASRLSHRRIPPRLSVLPRKSSLLPDPSGLQHFWSILAWAIQLYLSLLVSRRLFPSTVLGRTFQTNHKMEWCTTHQRTGLVILLL
jgi:hypothetical protein